jgi:hypothetical protein
VLLFDREDVGEAEILSCVATPEPREGRPPGCSEVVRTCRLWEDAAARQAAVAAAERRGIRTDDLLLRSTKSLDELDPAARSEPEHDTNLVRTCNRLRRRKIGDFRSGRSAWREHRNAVAAGMPPGSDCGGSPAWSNRGTRRGP